jgi:ABC-2 type transport system permease protein
LRKIAALYVNEMIKTSRKISIIIILGIMILLVAGGGALAKFEEYQYSKYSSSDQNSTWQTQEMNQQLTSYKSQLTTVQDKLKTASAQDQYSLKSQQDSLQSQVDLYQYAIDHDINLNSSDYQANALRQLYQYKSGAAQFKGVPDAAMTTDMKNELAQDNSYIATLQKVVDNKDYSAYIDFSNTLINSDKTLSQGEKDIKIESNALRIKHDPKGEGSSGFSVDVAEQLVTQIENEKLSLLNGIDVTGEMQNNVPLTSDRRQTVKNELAVNSYKFAHNIGFSSSNVPDFKSSAFTMMYAFGDLMLVILMMILAGSSVSQELATGSIKSLIISPARRWKILTAKFLSLLTVLIAGGLIVYAESSIMYGALFGFSSGSPYIYAVGGVAQVMSFALYNFAYLYAGLIEVFVYMVLALMLSIITRNTAASVGISIAVYFGGSIINAVLLNFASGEWLKFLPFSNLSISSKIFPTTTASLMGAASSTNTAAVNTSLTFALCYVAVLLVCMGYTAFDSFTRRDIK